MAVGHNNSTNIGALVNQIRALVEQKNAHPIFHRAIDSTKGIQITGKFRTTHDTVPSPMSYITVRRRADKAVCSDGIGLAWRTGTIADGNYNVYLVDNNVLTDDMPIRQNGMILEENINTFLAYGITNIEPDEEYKFGLEIDSTWGMRACVYSGSIVASPDFDNAYDAVSYPTGYILSIGARLDGYEPQASGTHFGISVMGTENSDWIYDDIRITSIVQGHAASLFKLYANPSYFSENKGAQLTMVGGGHGSPTISGITWYLWNNDSSAWETLVSYSGSLTATHTYDLVTMSGYIDNQNYVNLMVMTDDAADDGELNIDYVKLSNTPVSGIHTGNMTDIYIHAPGAISRTTANLTGITGNTVELDSLNHPIYEIESVYYTAGGPIFGELIRDSVSTTGRYTLQNSDPNSTYSIYEDLSLSVPEDASISIVYTYYTEGPVVQAFLEHEDNRLPNSDILAKIAPPAIISINNLDYRGTIEAEDLKTKLATWINQLVRSSFEISDMIAYMYSEGVTYINLDTMNITVTVYDNEHNITVSNQEISTSYTISEPNTFYTDSLKLIGITKL